MTIKSQLQHVMISSDN